MNHEITLEHINFDMFHRLATISRGARFGEWTVFTQSDMWELPFTKAHIARQGN